MDIKRYAALVNWALHEFVDVATLLRAADGGWWQQGGNPGGYHLCGHKHRTYEAAETCGRRFFK